MPKKDFLLVVLDHDNKTFSVEGPMYDDTPWIKAVVTAQEAGRNVNCSSIAGVTAAVAAARTAAQFKYIKAPYIVTPDLA